VYGILILTIMIMMLLIIVDIILLKAFMNLEIKVKHNRMVINTVCDKLADLKIYLMKVGIYRRDENGDDNRQEQS